MKGKKDQFEYMIIKDFEQLAKEEEEDILKDDSIQMPEGFKESLRAKLEEQIEEKEREELYSKLSEEDRLALEVGHKVLEEEKNKEVEIEVTRKKKRRKLYLTLAASLVLVMSISVTSIGRPGRVITLVKQAIGDREVEKINSSDENLTIVEENEEKAYQKADDEFGAMPVKIVLGPAQMKFDRMEMDDELLTAEFIYNYNESKVVYFVNASFSNTSRGVDVEDELQKQHIEKINGCEITIKEYRTPKTNKERYSARFEYKGLEYFLIGTMPENDFNLIVNNLFFSK